jgi:anti-sigma factor RsiW
MADHGDNDIPEADKQAIHAYIDNELNLEEIKQLRQRLNKRPELFDYLLRMERVTDQLRCAFDVKSFGPNENPSFRLDDGDGDIPD